MNIPNLLSISRILFLAPIIIFFEYNFYLISLLTFLVASLTDYLDGYLARKNKLTSDLGSLLDPLADKIFVSILLIWMTFNFQELIILISSILIVSREISISYLRLFFISKSKNLKEVKSDLIGKSKTAFQMTGLGLLIISPLTSDIFLNISLILVFLSAVLSWYSFIIYLNKWIV